MSIIKLIIIFSFSPLLISSQTIWPEPGSTPTGGWIATEWHQQDPFNAYCPYDSVNGGKSLVGCVGLCMAQIVNYHQPVLIKQFSDEDDYWSDLNNFKLLLDRDNHKYNAPDWNDLNAFLSGLSWPIQDDESAAKLAFLCGAAVHTRYSASFSNSLDDFLAPALVKRFGFVYTRWQEPSADLFRALKLNMQDSLPAIIVFTRNSFSPHAMIVDGFDEQGPGAFDDLYHLHYGGGKNQAFSFWANLNSFTHIDPPISGGFDQIKFAVVDISTKPIKPVAEFAADATTGYAPFTVVFRDSSYGTVTDWRWDFGDGSAKSHGKIVSHMYKNPGLYSVTLQVSNETHSSTITKENLIAVTINQYPFKAESGPGYKALDNSYGSKLMWVDIDRNNGFELAAESYPVGAAFWQRQNSWSRTGFSLKWSYPPGCVSFTDLDSDNDVDVFVSEWKNYLYRNQQNKFSDLEQIWLPMPAYTYSCWADFDNDGDKDLLPAGSPCTLYYNVKGSLTPSGIELPNSLRTGCYDFDNDGRVDIIFYGGSDTKLYKNTGVDGFVETATMPGADYVELGDFNNDKSADFLLTRPPSAWLYQSSERGWQLVNWPGGIPKLTGSARFIDFNLDGFLEIVTCGASSDSVSLYLCSNLKYEFAKINLDAPIASGDLQFADFNRDQMPDLFLEPFILLNTNHPFLSNKKAPQNLHSAITGDTAILTWDAVSDSIQSVTYNVRIGTTEMGNDILSPLACTDSLDNGWRYLPEPGNAFLCTHKIMQLPAGTYYWSVQAIDGAGNGSCFSPTSTFVISESNHIDQLTEEIPLSKLSNHPNPFNSATTITFSIQKSGRVRISIFNLNGQVVKTLADQDMPAGVHQVIWHGDTEEGNKAGSGIYFCVLQFEGKKSCLKIILLS